MVDGRYSANIARSNCHALAIRKFSRTCKRDPSSRQISHQRDPIGLSARRPLGCALFSACFAHFMGDLSAAPTGKYEFSHWASNVYQRESLGFVAGGSFRRDGAWPKAQRSSPHVFPPSSLGALDRGWNSDWQSPKPQMPCEHKRPDPGLPANRRGEPPCSAMRRQLAIVRRSLLYRSPIAPASSSAQT